MSILSVRAKWDNESILRRLFHNQKSLVPFALARLNPASSVTLQDAALEAIRSRSAEQRVKELMK